MKSTKKLIALMLLALLCLSLTGCMPFGTLSTPLADQRAEHAVWKTKNNTSVILYGGEEYYPLHSTNTLSEDAMFDFDIYLTNPDVPLLMRDEGSPVRISYDKTLLLVDHLDRFYCRADEFDQLQARLQQEFVPTRYGYYYSYRDKDYNINDYNIQYISEFYTLSKEERDLLFSITDTTEPVTIDFSDSIEIVTISGYSEDLLQQREELRVYSLAGRYYLSDRRHTVFPVPEEQTSALESMIERVQNH